MFDRFLFRRPVKPIRSADGRQRLLWGDDATPVLSATLTPAELDRARKAASALPWSAEAREALETVLRELSREGYGPATGGSGRPWPPLAPKPTWPGPPASNPNTWRCWRRSSGTTRRSSRRCAGGSSPAWPTRRACG